MNFALPEGDKLAFLFLKQMLLLSISNTLREE